MLSQDGSRIDVGPAFEAKFEQLLCAKLGFRVALDDLGAGYSGLKLWSEIRPDIVKIDRHFIQGVDQDRTKQQFVTTILKTATALGCRVITEGVETEGEYATLRKIGVEMLQGYYFGRPIPVSELVDEQQTR